MFNTRTNISQKIAFTFALSAFAANGFMLAHATETSGEKAKNAAKEGWKDTKQGYRNTKAEIICKTNDKKCLEAKAKAKTENAKDEIEQEAGEIKDKID
ncbi:MAG TPA: hypothetical protein VM901_07050 [Bdellovibrionota bacterium]|nr:hypothetical protein [Bdellovibrionota bacterium]